MRRVLVVDDSPSVRMVIERTLASVQTKVLCASSGSEALGRIEECLPDVVICDVIMPDMDGYELCAWVRARARFARTPVLLMSGIVNDAVRARAAQVHADDLLVKPFAADALTGVIERLIARAAEPAAAPRAGASGGGELLDVAPFGAAGVKRLLARLGAMAGINLAVLIDRDGFVIESSGDAAADAEVAAALMSSAATSSAGLGRDLRLGGLQSMLLEYDRGTISLHTVADAALLAVIIAERQPWGRVRYCARKVLPELARVL